MAWSVRGGMRGKKVEKMKRSRKGRPNGLVYLQFVVDVVREEKRAEKERKREEKRAFEEINLDPPRRDQDIHPQSQE